MSKLQFAFGANPRRKKAKKSHRKSKKNPQTVVVKKGKKTLFKKRVATPGEIDAAYKKALGKFKGKPRGKDGKPAGFEHAAKRMKKHSAKRAAHAEKILAEAKRVATHTEGTLTSSYTKPKKFKAKKAKGASVAKKRKSHKKAKHVKKAKHTKVKHHKKAKHTKVKHHKKAKHAKKAHKKAKSHRKAKSHKRRRKMVKHAHLATTRHLPKGAVGHITGKKRKKSYKVKATFKTRKGRVKLKGSVKVTKRGLKGILRANPFKHIFGRNPLDLSKLNTNSKKYLGHNFAELGGLAAGAALVPVLNAYISKTQVGATINSWFGSQFAGSVLPLIAGVGLNVAGDKFKNEPAKLVGEGLATAGLLGIFMGLTQTYIAPHLPGMAGITYTPNMSGIRYTPGMSGIRYTPGMSGSCMGCGPMGVRPQLNGPRADFGSRADFGARPRADFGGMGSTMDLDIDENLTDSDIMENTMGSMG